MGIATERKRNETELRDGEMWCVSSEVMGVLIDVSMIKAKWGILLSVLPNKGSFYCYLAGL